MKANATPAPTADPAAAQAAWQAKLAAEPIEPGDFIAAGDLGQVCGFVLDAGPIRLGAALVPAYRVQTASALTFILYTDARLVSPGAAHLARMFGAPDGAR